MNKKFAMFAVCLAGRRLCWTRRRRINVWQTQMACCGPSSEGTAAYLPLFSKESLCVAIFPSVRKVAVGIGPAMDGVCSFAAKGRR
jgi:hypothetical protein